MRFSHAKSHCQKQRRKLLRIKQKIRQRREQKKNKKYHVPKFMSNKIIEIILPTLPTDISFEVMDFWIPPEITHLEGHKKINTVFNDLFKSMPSIKGEYYIANTWFIPYPKLRPRIKEYGNKSDFYFLFHGRVVVTTRQDNSDGADNHGWSQWISPSAAAIKRSECFKLYSQMIHAKEWNLTDQFYDPRGDGMEFYEERHNYIYGVAPVTEYTTFMKWCQTRMIIRPPSSQLLSANDIRNLGWDAEWLTWQRYNHASGLVY